MALLDSTFFGLRRRSVPAHQPVGHLSTAVIGGYVDRDERDSTLQGTRRYKTFSDILANTSIVAASVRYFLNLVSKAGWKVEAAEDTGSEGEAQRLADLVQDIMDDLDTPWHRVVRRCAMFRFYGFSVQEWVAKRRDEDGAIGYRDIAPRAQLTIERWDIDPFGELMGVTQRSPWTGEEIYLPRGKVIYAVDDSLNNSPEGLGLFRHLVPHARRLARYEQLEGFGYEADLRGLPVGRAPLAALAEQVRAGLITQEDASAAIAPLKELVQKHIKTPDLGVLLDSITYQAKDEASTPSQVRQWDMEVINSDTADSQVAVATAIERLNRELARVLGTEVLLLGSDGKGSLALARDKTQTFALMVDSTLREVSETFEHDFLKPLWQLNGWDPRLMPSLKTEAVQYRSVEEVTGSLADMAQAGAILEPDDPAIAEVRDLLGLSRPPPVDLMGPGSDVEPTEDEPGDATTTIQEMEQGEEEETDGAA